MSEKVIMVYGDTKLPPPFSLKPPLKISADDFYIQKLVSLGFRVEYIDEDGSVIPTDVKEGVNEFLGNISSEFSEMEEKNEEMTELELPNSNIVHEDEELNIEQVIQMAEKATSLSETIEDEEEKPKKSPKSKKEKTSKKSKK